jgi:hypothetical protein
VLTVFLGRTTQLAASVALDTRLTRVLMVLSTYLSRSQGVEESSISAGSSLTAETSIEADEG